MATVIDAARDAEAEVLCASEDYASPLVSDIGFTINASTAEVHIPAPDGDNGVNNSADAAAPIIDQSGFWLASVPATVRF